MVIGAADHFHVGPGVKCIHRRFLFISREAVGDQLFNRCVVAYDEAVKLPFVS